MNLSKRTILAAVIGLMMTASLGFAQSVQPAHMHGHGWGDGMPFFSDALDLTDAQRTQIKEIFHNAKPAMKPLMEQARQSHQAMMQLITSGSFDQAKAQAIANQEAQVHAQVAVLHAQAASQAYQVLTADQKTKFNELLAKHQQRMQERMQQHQQSEQAPQTQQ
jgi:Spy/CpxP family protein refolding chaperone